MHTQRVTLSTSPTHTHNAARDTFSFSEASPVSIGQVSIEEFNPQLAKLSTPSPTRAAASAPVLREAAPAPEVCVLLSASVPVCVCVCVCVRACACGRLCLEVWVWGHYL